MKYTFIAVKGTGKDREAKYFSSNNLVEIQVKEWEYRMSGYDTSRKNF